MRSLLEKSLNLDYVKLSTKWWTAVFIKFTNSVWRIADQNFYDTCFTIFYPTASATAYGWRPKFFRAEHSATAEGENCAYGPTLEISVHCRVVVHQAGKYWCTELQHFLWFRRLLIFFQKSIFNIEKFGPHFASITWRFHWLRNSWTGTKTYI